MFFPKLRRQAKWVFVFLALSFSVGFVVFGVGGNGGGGLGDLLQGSSSSTSGPSVSDAQKKIDKGNLVAYKELADAYRQDGNLDQAITAGEQYLKVRPKDYEYMRTVAGDYEGRASQQRDQATAIQDQVTSSTGGATFAPPGNSRLGRALAPGKIDQELTTAANQKLTQLYSGLQGSFARSTQLYQQVTANSPNDVLLQLLLANAAYQSRNNPVALKAYRRVIKLAPGSRRRRAGAPADPVHRRLSRPAERVRLPRGGGAMNFDVQTEKVDDSTYVIALGGEVDLYTAPEFKQQLLDVIAKGAKDVVVDFTRTTFIDSTTLGVLVGGVKRLRAQDGRLALVCSDRNITKIFEITGLDRVFTIYPTRDEALAKAGASAQS